MTDISELAHALAEAEQMRDRYDACRREAIADCTRQRDLKIHWKRVAMLLASRLQVNLRMAYDRPDMAGHTVPSLDEIIKHAEKELEKEDGKNNHDS